MHVLGRGAAATADQAHADVHEVVHEVRHVLRRAQIDVAAFDRARNAGIRLRRQRRGSDGANALQGVQHGHRTYAAVAANDVGAPGFQLRAVVLGTGSVEAVAVFVDGDLRHDRQLGIDVARRQDRLMQLLEIAEGLQDHQVDALFVQRGNLLAEGLAGFGQGDLAQRLDAHTKRSDGSGHVGVKVLGRLAGQASAMAVDLDQFVHTSVPRQAKRIRAEGVCFYDLGSGLQIVLMNAADQVGRRQVQLVVAAIDENALGIQQGTHGAVA